MIFNNLLDKLFDFQKSLNNFAHRIVNSPNIRTEAFVKRYLYLKNKYQKIRQRAPVAEYIILELIKAPCMSAAS